MAEHSVCTKAQYVGSERAGAEGAACHPLHNMKVSFCGKRGIRAYEINCEKLQPTGIMSIANFYTRAKSMPKAR